MKIFYLFFIVTMICGCNGTCRKDPVFTSDISSVKNSLKKIIDFEEIDIYGYESTIDKKYYSTLSVEIIDSPNRIRDSSEAKDVGQKVVDYFQSNLADKSEFNHFMIGFTHRDKNWRNSSETIYYHSPEQINDR